MSAQPVETSRPSLKNPTGWFAAGPAFRQALTLLSNGAFKLFALICLEANRKTGRFEATQKQLAAALSQSKRIIGRYVAELETAAVCRITPARNQYAPTVFEVRDEFWPYHRIPAGPEPPVDPDRELQRYIESIQECYLSLGDVHVGFRPVDRSIAKNLYQRRIPLGFVRDAMLLGACRKYESWLNGKPSQPIQTLRYFEHIIKEVRNQPLPPGYSNYLRRKLDSYAAAWAASDDGSGKTGRAPLAGPSPASFPQPRRVLAQKGNPQAGT